MKWSRKQADAEKQPRPAESAEQKAARRRVFRAGGYSSLVVALVVAVAVAANLLVSSLPANLTHFDTTDTGIYTLSQQTQEVVSGLEQDVDVYLIAQSGAESATLQKFLAQYTALSDRLKVSVIDPDVYPGFASQYTDQALYNNSLIVVSGERSRYIAYPDIFQTSYTSYYSTSTEFDGEGQLTGAVSYVTSEDLPKVYALPGHGEETVPSALRSAMEEQNIQLEEELSLVSVDAVPEDADAVLLYGPSRDLSQEDARKLTDYVERGGRLLLFTNDIGEELPNLDQVTELFGVHAKQGLVFDPDSQHNAGYPHYLLPDIRSHTVTAPLVEGGYHILVPMAHAIAVDETLPDGVTVTPLLKTSDSAYNKADGQSVTTLEQEDGDETGSFSIAAAAEKTISEASEDAEAVTAQLVWAGSTQLFNETINAMVAGANTDLFLNAVGWVCEQDETISIHAKSLDAEYLTIPTGSRGILTAVTVVILPAALIIAGVVVWKRRKNR